MGTFLEIQLLGAASKRASVFPLCTGRLHKYTENAAESEANACGSETRTRGALEPERLPARAPSLPGLGSPGWGRGPAPGTDRGGCPPGPAGVSQKEPTSPLRPPQEPSHTVASSPLLFGPVAPDSPSAASLWDAPVASGVGCPRYRVSAAERVPAARHSQASAPEAEPGARRPLAREPAGVPRPRPPR